MGMYCYITEDETLQKKHCEHPLVNELFQEALEVCPDLLIEQFYFTTTNWLGNKKKQTRFNVLHECRANDGRAFQARYQISASGPKEIVMAYLYGIINGALSAKKNKK